MRLLETDAILYDIFINFFSLKINFFSYSDLSPFPHFLLDPSHFLILPTLCQLFLKKLYADK